MPMLRAMLATTAGLATAFPCLAGARKPVVNPLPKGAIAGKHPYGVTLALTKDLCRTVWKQKSTRDNRDLGEALCLYAERVATAVFAPVSRRDTNTAAEPDAGEPQLSARFVEMRRNEPAWAWHDQEVAILLEWSMRDRVGRLVRVKTIQGVARDKAGTLFTRTRRRHDAVRAAIDDVFARSVREMISSPELRKLAGSW
jgi:hypothetical protein